MKQLFIFTFFTFFSQHVVAQYLNNNIEFYFEDAVGRKDTILLGLNPNATHNIDTIFNEVDIFGTPLDSLDVRIIQRDTLSNSCIYNYLLSTPNNPQFFVVNRDLKIDIRNDNFFSPNNYAQTIQNNFEIEVHTFDFPVIVNSNLSNAPSFFNLSYIDVIDSTCSVITNSISLESFNFPFTLSSNIEKTLIVHFDFEIGIEEFTKTAPSWSIMPNPSNNNIKLIGEKEFIGNIEIINSIGKVIQKQDLSTSSNPTIEVNHLEKGMYLIRYFNNLTKSVSINKFIKE